MFEISKIKTLFIKLKIKNFKCAKKNFLKIDLKKIAAVSL